MKEGVHVSYTDSFSLFYFWKDLLRKMAFEVCVCGSCEKIVMYSVDTLLILLLPKTFNCIRILLERVRKASYFFVYTLFKV